VPHGRIQRKHSADTRYVAASTSNAAAPSAWQSAAASDGPPTSATVRLPSRREKPRTQYSFSTIAGTVTSTPTEKKIVAPLTSATHRNSSGVDRNPNQYATGITATAASRTMSQLSITQ